MINASTTNNINCNTNVHCGPTTSDESGGAPSVLESRQELNDRYSPSEVASGLNQLQFEGTLRAAWEIIADQDSPPAMRDAANEIINQARLASGTELSPDMMADIRSSVAGQDAEDLGWQGLMDEFQEAQAKQDKENQDEVNKTGGAKERNGKGNWMVELAKALADIQNKFLTAAMAASKLMSNSAGEETKKSHAENLAVAAGKSSETGDSTETIVVTEDDLTDENRGRRTRFIEAQAEYSANIQMFTTMSTQTATSLKSIGEALSAISRKQ